MWAIANSIIISSCFACASWLFSTDDKANSVMLFVLGMVIYAMHVAFLIRDQLGGR